MNEIRDLIIGIDFARGSSQITYYDRRAGEPRSVPEKAGSADFEIPTRLCIGTGRKEYCIGSEALYFAREQNGILTDDLYELALSEKPVRLHEKSWPVHELLAKYIVGLLDVLGISDVVRNTRCLMVAVRELSPVLVRNLSRACEELGFGRDEYSLLDYSQCFFYYAMTQRRENWNRNIGWYQFQGNDVTFRKLSVTSGAPPVLIRLRQAGRRTLPEEQLDRDTVFTGFVKETLSAELYSCILITGEGFSREWSSRSARVMCQQQRKVYYGNNLFAKGACAAGKERREDRNLKNYRFLSDSMILTNVGMDMRVGGASAYVPLIEAGKNWYEYHIDFEMILDGEKELAFLVSGAGENISRKAVMALEGLPSRPPRTTRLQVQMHFTSRELCHVEVRDLGFGEMFPASGKVWKEEIDWAGSLPVGSAAAPDVVEATAVTTHEAELHAAAPQGEPVHETEPHAAAPQGVPAHEAEPQAAAPQDEPAHEAEPHAAAPQSRSAHEAEPQAVAQQSEPAHDTKPQAAAPQGGSAHDVKPAAAEHDAPAYNAEPPAGAEQKAPPVHSWPAAEPLQADQTETKQPEIQLWGFVRQRRSRRLQVKRRRRRLTRRRRGLFGKERTGHNPILQEEQP
ncbi:MAG: hypothetical protein IKE03_07540 [Blautia sp.]|nr:hypothetical protein [Blautia sp.]